MATTSPTRVVLVRDDGREVSDAFAEVRSDGAWNIRFKIPWERNARTFVRATQAQAETLLVQAAGQVEDAITQIRTIQEDVTAQADALPRDNRP